MSTCTVECSLRVLCYVQSLTRVKSNCCNKCTSDRGMFKAIEMKRVQGAQIQRGMERWNSGCVSDFVLKLSYVVKAPNLFVTV